MRPVKWLIAVLLLASAAFLFVRNTDWWRSGLLGASTSKTVTNERTPWSWTDDYKPPLPSDITVYPFEDRTGLNAGYGYELENLCGHLVQAYLGIVGKPVTSPPYYHVIAAQAKIVRAQIEYDDIELLSRLGRDINTRKIIAIRITRRPDGVLQADAIAIDPASSKEVGRWRETATVEQLTFDDIYDLTTELALSVSGGLAGEKNKEAMLSRLQQPQTNEARAQSAAAAARSAFQNIAVPALPQLRESHRTCMEALASDPRCAEAWATAAFVLGKLGESLEKTETVYWRETNIRCYVAGHVAWLLDPEDAFARAARYYSLYNTGHVAKAMKLTKANLEKHPYDAPSRMINAMLWQQPDKFPRRPAGEPVRDQYLWDLLSPYIRARTGSAAVAHDEALARQAFAPNIWHDWADALNHDSEIGLARLGHLAACIEGSLFSILESCRRLELEQHQAEARAAVENTSALLGWGKLQPDQKTSAAYTSALRSACMQSTAGLVFDIALKSFPWRPDSTASQLLKLAHDNHAEALTKTKSPREAPIPAFGIDYSAYDWLSMSQRPAIDAAMALFNDVAAILGSPDAAMQIGKSIEELYPNDPAVLDTWASFYSYQYRNQNLANEYQKRVHEADYLYPPLLRRSTWFQVLVQKRPEVYQKVYSILPFHLRTLEDIISGCYDIGAYKQAADYAKCLLDTFPFRSEYWLTLLQMNALRDNRLIVPADVARIEAQLPPEWPDRELTIVWSHVAAGELDRALTMYAEKARTDAKLRSNDLIKMVQIAGSLGKWDLARELTEEYVKRDGTSLKTCSVLTNLAEMMIARGDLKQAAALHARAAAVDNWKGSVVATGANIAWLDGRHDHALAETKRNMERYRGSNLEVHHATMLLAKGDAEAALRVIEKAIASSGNSRPFARFTATAQRMQGDTTGALKTLQNFAANNHGYKPAGLLAEHYFALGEWQKAGSWADEMHKRARTRDEVKESLRMQCIASLRTGNIAAADECARHLYVLDASSRDASACMAEVALAKGEVDVAIALSEPNRNVPEPASIVGARALMKKGRNDEAVDLLANMINCTVWPEPEWFLAQGDAHAAMGRSVQAAASWNRVAKVGGPHCYAAKEASTRNPGTLGRIMQTFSVR